MPRVEPALLLLATVAAMSKLHRLGWIAFTASAVVFLMIGIRDADALSIVAGVLFTVGCVLFLLPER